MKKSYRYIDFEWLMPNDYKGGGFCPFGWTSFSEVDKATWYKDHGRDNNGDVNYTNRMFH